jgi:hypothetical protein
MEVRIAPVLCPMPLRTGEQAAITDHFVNAQAALIPRGWD